MHRWRWSTAILLLAAGVANASEPQAAFRVEEGWVRFVVTQDDRAVPEVTVRVMDRPGAPFVEGEAEEGAGTFPAPPGADCVVTFSIAGKEADPILLRFPDRRNRAEPERVLITFDRRPCCNVAKLRSPETGSAAPWLPWAELLIGVACLSGCGWLWWRAPASRMP
jgi:hypothetical protein